MVERFGFREVREVSTVEAEDFVAYLNAKGADTDSGEDVAQGGELTVEQYEEMVARMKADADRHGRARPLG